VKLVIAIMTGLTSPTLRRTVVLALMVLGIVTVLWHQMNDTHSEDKGKTERVRPFVW